jgi:hypothetical protein
VWLFVGFLLTGTHVTGSLSKFSTDSSPALSFAQGYP